MQHCKATLPTATTIAVLITSIACAGEVTVCSIAANRAGFDHQNVTLQGTVVALKETRSRAGNDYTTFKLQDPSGGCSMSIFTWGHPTITNDNHVRVEGVFETEHHQGRYTFYNEVEATKVTPLPQ
jgi:uncharacterized protein YdeI (BOF family)